MVSFGDAVSLFFKRYTDFEGRSRRSEYWWVQLFLILSLGIPAGIAFAVGSSDGGGLNPLGIGLLGIVGLAALGIVVPSIALFVRRLHDINQTGWIYLAVLIVGLIPVIGILGSIAQIVIGCIPGTEGPNKYGPDPKAPGMGMADTFS
ncbi:MAG: DUF805 domain-containing protein [Pseudomonadota bacterium]